MTVSNSDQFVNFVVARHKIYLCRAAGNSPPWTSDRILQTYRFCNVYRELDAVTKFIRARHVGSGHRVWFDIVVARLVNEPGTIAELPVYQQTGWNPQQFIHTLQRRARAGARVFNPAYIVSTNGHAMDKPTYLAKHVLTPLWKSNSTLHQRVTLAAAQAQLASFNGLGSFMSAQVVADMKNTAGQKLAEALDWWTWASPGPGSLRGMNRILDRGGVKTWPERTLGSWLDHVRSLRETVNERFQELEWTPLCAQDTQNCLCEFDKYERARLGEGTPKQLFRAV